MDAGRASESAKRNESQLRTEEEAFKLAGELSKIKVQGEWDFRKELMKMDGDIAEVKDDNAGGYIAFYKGREGKIVRYSSAAVQATMDGTEIPTSSITVEYSGLKSNG